MASLKDKFVYQLALSATQVLLPLITYPYITRVLGPENLGKVNYVDFLSQLLIVFAGFGIPFYAVREISIVRNDTVKRAAFIKEMVVLQSSFALIAGVVFCIATYRQFLDTPFLYGCGLVNILISAFSFEWYMQGTESFRYTAIRTIVLRIAMLLAFFIFINNSNDYLLYFGIFTIANLLLVITNSYKVIAENQFVQTALQLKRHLRPLWHFFLTSSAISIYIYFDTIILEQLTHHAQAVGYYTTTIKLVKVCLMVLLAIGTVLMPRVSFLAGSGDVAAVKKHLDKSLLYVITLGIPISTGLFLLAPEIINVLAGEHFTAAIPLMQILALLPLAIGLSNVFCFQTLVPFNKEKIFLAAASVGCFTSVGLNLLLIPHLSAAGAAWSNMITEILITIITGWYAFKVIRFAIPAAVILQTIFVCLLFLPLMMLWRNIFVTPLYILLAGISSAVLLYVLMQYRIFKNSAIKETITYLSGILKLNRQ